VNITDMLKSAEGNSALNALAKSSNISPEQLDQILITVVPALSHRIERNTLSRGGLADTVSEALKPEHAQALNDPDYATQPAAIDTGNRALNAVFGSKSTSRAVAAQAAMSSGIEQAIIQKLLPIIASLVMAALSKALQGGGLADILKKLPDLAGGGAGPQGDPDTPQPSRRRRIEQPRQADPSEEDPIPSPAPQPRGDRSPWNTPSAPVPQSSSGRFGGDPLPMPGDRIPGINSLASTQLTTNIRQGTRIDGKPVNKIVRNAIGSQLGFPSQGFISWVIRAVILRNGLALLQKLLRRATTR
jgi:hypothetical protein